MAEFQRDTQINIFAVFMESHYTPFFGESFAKFEWVNKTKFIVDRIYK